MKTQRFDIFALVVISVLCYAITPVWFQNDTFYTIKVGEWIANHGIDMQDHFSWHRDLPYTYPHWFYDYCIYKVYATFGLTGIYCSSILLSCLLGFTAYCVNRSLSGNRIIAFFVTLTVLYVLSYGFITARAQMCSYILMLLTVFFIEVFLNTRKTVYLVGLFLISFLIANIHAAVWPFFFILFLPYIGEYCVAFFRRCAGKKDNIGSKLQIVYDKNVLLLTVAALICLLAGLLTPIGDTPYTYLYRILGSRCASYISEHKPLILISSLKTLIIICLFLYILIFKDTKIRLKDLFMVGGLLLLTLASNRQLSMLALIGMISFGQIMSDFLNRKKPLFTKKFTDKILKPEWLIISFLATFIITFLYRIDFNIWLVERRPQIHWNTQQRYIDEQLFPIKACDFIIDSLDLNKIKLFNEYDYGSYLMYRNIPVFIDSRADLYTLNFNGEKNIFQDYFDVTGIKVFYDDIFDEYGVTHILIRQYVPLTVIFGKDIRYRELWWDDNFVLYRRETGGAAE